MEINLPAGTRWRHVQQLFNTSLEDRGNAKICGVVLKIVTEATFINYYISDSTGTIQCTFYTDLVSAPHLHLPSLGECVIVQGEYTRKAITQRKKNSQQYWLKLKIRHFKIVSPREEIIAMQKAITAREERRKEGKQEVSEKIAIFSDRQFKDGEQLIIRQLVLTILFNILQTNIDINSYSFTVAVLRNHRFCKQFVKDRYLSQTSINTALSETLKYFLPLNLIIQKPVPITGTSPQQFVVKRSLFDMLLGLTDKTIAASRENGITLERIVMAVNNKLGIHSQNKYVITTGFLGKIIKKLMDQTRIFRTADKVFFPNYD